MRAVHMQSNQARKATVAATPPELPYAAAGERGAEAQQRVREQYRRQRQEQAEARHPSVLAARGSTSTSIG